jgi:hypothetical protein
MSLLLSLLACGTMNTARPLEPGQHAAGLTFGGALLDMGAPIPIPSAVVEGRSGVTTLAERPLDVNYGVNLTAAAFGVAGLHAGASYLVLDQSGARPAISVADRLYVYTNLGDATKADRGWLFVDQLELTASWDLGGQLVYLGASEHLDLRNPRLLLSPYLGAELLRRKRLGVQAELRWLALNQSQVSDAIPWIPDDGRGALQPSLGLSYRFGGEL